MQITKQKWEMLKKSNPSDYTLRSVVICAQDDLIRAEAKELLDKNK